jgi:uncharacterized delta-60 repeat protein
MNIRKQTQKNYLQKQNRFGFLGIFAAVAMVAAIVCLTPQIEAAAGDLDTTFNMTGYTTTDFDGRTDHAYGIAIQSDGKTVVAGYSFNGSNFDFAIARYNPNGTLDTSFDTDGKVTTDFGSNLDQAFAVAIQTDGKIVVAGYGSTSTESGFGVVRYNVDGSLDPTFNGTGRVITPIGATAQAVAIQTDGKIVIAGDGFVIARYNTNGSLDTSFDGDGVVTTPMDGLTYGARGVAIQSDGKIVAAGQSRIGAQNAAFAVVRYNQNGSLDTSFDTDGKVITDFDVNYDEANAIAIQSDGKIVAAGYTETGGVAAEFALARYNINGSLDVLFDGDGKVTTPFSVNAGAIAVAIQSNNKIVAAGGCSNGSSVSSCIIRYNTDASLDASFGVGGKVSTPIGANSQFYAVKIQADGKIAAAGPTFVEMNDNFAVARYAGDVVTRRTFFDFDGDGKTDISIFRPSVGEWWYLKSSDGGNAAAQFGAGTDKITPGDFTGDGKTDIAFWRPSNGFWFVLRSEDFSYYSFPFGTTGDIPAVGDFDGDGKTDATIFRASTGTWYISKSSGGTLIQQFGQNGDVPVVSDYDGDGKADIAIYRVAVGEWWIQRSTAGLIAFQFGNSADKPVQGDFTGDGKADVALFRPSSGEWFVLRSEDQSYYSFPFGTSGDVPAPGDYDGDGKFDAAVFRPSSSTWYAQRSTAGTLIQGFGQSGDMPVPNAFVP